MSRSQTAPQVRSNKHPGPDISLNEQQSQSPLYADQIFSEPPNIPMQSIGSRDGQTESVNAPPTINTTGDHDLEAGSRSGSQVTINRKRWWSPKFKKQSSRGHSPETAEAHAKSPLKLIKEILFSNYANFLLVFIPVGIALHFVNVSPTVVFVMNFLAIVPLAAVSFHPLFSCQLSGSDFSFLLRDFCLLRCLC